MTLCEEKRGEQKDMKFLDEDRIILKYTACHLMKLQPIFMINSNH